MSVNKIDRRKHLVFDGQGYRLDLTTRRRVAMAPMAGRKGERFWVIETKKGKHRNTLIISDEAFEALVYLKGKISLEALNALPAVDGWLDIETNPPPANTPVLLCWYHGHWEAWQYEATCYETGKRIGGYSNVSYHGSATHWQPLPAPPEGIDNDTSR